MENLKYNTIKKNAECENNFNVEKFGRKNSVNWNHTNSILNWNKKYFDLIHVDQNHTKANQPVPDGSINTGSIHDSANMRAIEKILASPVHSLVPASPILLYGSTSDPPSPLHDTSAESVTPERNTKPHKNPPNLVPYVPDEPNSDPSLSDYSFSDSSDSSENEYYKQRQRAK